MTNIFHISSAEAPKTPTFDAIYLIRKPDADCDIPGLHFVAGDRPEIAICSSGKQWTDCLTPKISLGSGLVVSERIIDSILENNLSGVKIRQVNIDFSSMRKVPLKTNSDYFIISPTGAPPPVFYRVFEFSDEVFKYKFETGNPSDPRLKYGAVEFTQQIQKVLIDPEWQGEDFMKVPNRTDGIALFGAFYCSRKVVEIARRESWSNFCFYPFDRMGSAFGDFRKFSWPPETWYPKNQPM